MNKSDDPNAPKNQEIVQAPHEGRNRQGDIVADSTESAGQESDWETTSDLEAEAHKEPQNVAALDEDYSSGPDTFATKNGIASP